MGPLLFRPTVRVLSSPRRTLHPEGLLLLGLLRLETLVAALLCFELTLPLPFAAATIGVPFEMAGVVCPVASMQSSAVLPAFLISCAAVRRRL